MSSNSLRKRPTQSSTTGTGSDEYANASHSNKEAPKNEPVTKPIVNERGTRLRPLWRMIVTEMIAVTLWTTTLLSIFISTRLSLVPRALKDFQLSKITSTIAPFPIIPIPLPFALPALSVNDRFMVILVIVMFFWDAFGLSLGSTLNPAVTLSLAVTPSFSSIRTSKQIQYREALLLKLLVQFIATILAVFLVDTMFSFDSRAHAVLAPPSPNAAAHWLTASAFEALGTGTLAILALSMPHFFNRNKRFVQKLLRWFISTAMFVSAATVAADWSGACMNPALALGLAALHKDWASHHVYWIGPLSGAVIAAVFHVFVIERRFPLDGLKLETNSASKEE